VLTALPSERSPAKYFGELGLDAGTQVEFITEEDGLIRVQSKESPLAQLRGITTQLADHDIDVERMRWESKRAWSAHLDGNAL